MSLPENSQFIPVSEKVQRWTRQQLAARRLKRNHLVDRGVRGEAIAWWETREMQIRTFAELAAADKRTLSFTSLGLSTAGVLSPEDAAAFQQEVIAGWDLDPSVAEETRMSFERLRTLHGYGVLFYDAFTLAGNLCWLTMEQAFRDRFIDFYGGTITFITDRGDEKTMDAGSFADVYTAVRRGSHRKGGWKLKLHSSHPPIPFSAGLADLQRWARAEGLVRGQRNRRLESLYRRMRNGIAHPAYQLSVPPESAKSIRDLSEIINGLWGHQTVGGHLHPAPLTREILVIGWGIEDSHPIHTVMRADQLVEDSSGSAGWTYLIIRGVTVDDFWSFDAQLETTRFPSQHLWGPGNRTPAMNWLAKHEPQADSVDYLDRVFAVRAHDGAVSVYRSAVVVALTEEDRHGTWYLLRADFPEDAFNHVRHREAGGPCGEGHVLPECAVEEILTADWKDAATVLLEQFGVRSVTTLPHGRVPTLAEMNLN
jgi:hypothetical protein